MTALLRHHHCGTSIAEPAQKQPHPFHQQSGCEWRKDKANPLLRVNTLCSLQCLDTDATTSGS